MTVNNQLNKILSSAPVAGAVPLFDTNANLSADNFLSGLTSTASAAGTTTLTVNSTKFQVITGTTTQTIVLPNATTLANGTSFVIINQSTGAVTIRNATPTTIYTVAAGNIAEVTLTANGSSAGTWNVPVSSSGLTFTGFQIFTTAGAGTYTPTPGTVAIMVELAAGGGGGGGVTSTSGSSSAAGGGGSGSYQRKFYASIASSYSYTVGTRGNGGAAGTNNGTSGTDSIFDVMDAGGGAGGQGSAGALTTTGAISQGGGGGNNPGVADVYGGGTPGTNGLMLFTNYAGGNGAPSYFGGGGRGLVNTPGTGSQTNAYGAGGGGATAVSGGSNAAGGNGAPGVIIVWEYA